MTCWFSSSGNSGVESCATVTSLPAREAKGRAAVAEARRLGHVIETAEASAEQAKWDRARLAADAATVWTPALGRETEQGSEIAATTTTLLGRTVRLIVRRQPRAAGDQLAIDDLDGWRLHAIITNVGPERMSAAAVEAHHRLRGGIPEDTIRALKHDFGMIHAPVQPFFGNWLYWQACALAHNVALWLRTLALPRAFRRARGKRLRLAFLNVAARLVRHGRRLHLRFAAGYPHLDAVAAALRHIHTLPRFG